MTFVGNLWNRGERGVSQAIGIVLMVAIVILLVSVAGVMVTSFGESSIDSSAVHGTGAHEFSINENDERVLVIEPQSVQTRDTTFHLAINGKQVHQWNGREPLEVTCLYPNDQVQIITEKAGTTNLLHEHTMEHALDCSVNILERFKYVFVEGNQYEVGTFYDFGLAIDPDGPGTDDTYGNPTFKDDIGPIPLSSEFHYSQRYEQEIEGLGGPDTPVWVFVMADNVHWQTPDAYVDRNWTDSPPPGDNPGEGTYEINGNSLDPTPFEGEGEPTNDVYLVFEPGCDESLAKVVADRGGYENQILMDDTVVVSNTNTQEGITFDAPGIPCFEK